MTETQQNTQFETEIRNLVDRWEQRGLDDLLIDGRLHWRAKEMLVAEIVQESRTIRMTKETVGEDTSSEEKASDALQAAASTESAPSKPARKRPIKRKLVPLDPASRNLSKKQHRKGMTRDTSK